MLSQNDKDEAWKLYKQYSGGKSREFGRISHTDSKARRAAYVMLMINNERTYDEFQTQIQIIDDMPAPGADSNRNTEYERKSVEDGLLLFGKKISSWAPTRTKKNEPISDEDYFSPGPQLGPDDWTPADTNSGNFVWLNKVANLFELPGAAKDEDVPFIQKVKEIRDQQKQDSSDQRKTSWLDYAQIGLDVAGILEPTPFSDGINSAVSLMRAVAEPQNAGNHLVNAGISIASMIPYIGDFAKVHKSYGKGLSAVEHLGQMKNNRSRLGRMASVAYESLGGGSLDRMHGYGGTPGINGKLSASGGGSGIGLGGLMAGGGGGIGGGMGGSPASGGGGGMPNIPQSVQGLFGVFGRMTAVVGIAVVAFTKLYGWVEKTAAQGREMLEDQRAGARWSPGASFAIMQYDLSRIRREGERGRYLGPATSYLAKSQDFVETQIGQYSMPYARAATNIQASLNYIAGYIAAGLNKLDVIQNTLEFIFGYFKNNPAGPANPIDAFQQNPNPIPTAPKKFDFDQKNNKAQRGFI
jgi:hypothetical protein